MDEGLFPKRRRPDYPQRIMTVEDTVPPPKPKKVSDPKDVEAQLERLNKVRNDAAEIGRRRERIAGELEGKKKSLADLEARAVSDFGVEVSGLESLAAELRDEADKAIAKAEAILGGVKV
jgi:hypothetical protein